MNINATDYLNSNFLSGDTLEPNVIIEAAIVSARSHQFEEEEKEKLVIYLDYEGKGVVLNQTRTKALIRAYGINTDNWIGKPIKVFRGETMYAGKTVPCVVIEPIVATQIAASPPRPALERGKTTITSGKGAWTTL